jgi:hypothetical protein
MSSAVQSFHCPRQMSAIPHGKLGLMDPATQESARGALDALWRDGSPVVRPENIEEIITIGWRRWSSFDRRNAKRSVDFERRVEDLAKGLRDKFEAKPSLAGPLIEDYRHQARVLAREFDPAG